MYITVSLGFGLGHTIHFNAKEIEIKKLNKEINSLQRLCHWRVTARLKFLLNAYGRPNGIPWILLLIIHTSCHIPITHPGNNLS